MVYWKDLYQDSQEDSNPVLPVTSSTHLDKLCKCSLPPFPHLRSGDNSNTLIKGDYKCEQFIHVRGQEATEPRIEQKKQFIKVHREHSRTESGMKSPSTTASEPRNYIMNKSFKSFILFAPQNFLFSMTQAKGKKRSKEKEES